MKSAKFFFFLMLVIVVATGVLLFSKISLPTLTSPKIPTSSQLINKIKDALKFDFDYSIEYSSTVEVASSAAKPSSYPTNSPLPTTKPTSSPRLESQTNPTQKPKTCYSYTVPHLDGSSSTKCYSQTDFQSLQSLGIKYSAAKSDYNFESSVAAMYSKSSSDFASEFFKKPAEDAKARAQAAQDLMGEVALQMYAIEARGW